MINMQEITQMIETGKFPDTFTAMQIDRIKALYDFGHVREAQQLAMKLMEKKLEKTLL